VPIVQGNLSGVDQDDPKLVEHWRKRLIDHGVWANAPVPMYPYPSSPGYRAMWGEPDDQAWERAHDYYLRTFQDFSDIFGEFFGFGEMFGGGGGGRRRSRVQRGADLREDLTLEFEEAFFGSESRVTVRRHEACEECHGSGAAAGKLEALVRFTTE